jgi:type I restriction enzyme, S subunit
MQKVKISYFLKERESRIKPEEANKMGFKRLNKIDFSGEIHLTEKTTNTDMILIKKGDLVISGINVEKGAVAVYQGKEDILATIHYSAYIFDEKKIDIQYFKTFLKSKSFRDVINSQIRSGIKTELKAKSFLPLEINLPDLKNQIQIRNKLNSVSGEILELDLINNKNESYISSLRQAILSEAVSGKLVPQDPKDEPASELLKKIKAEKEKLIREKKIKKDKPLPPITEEEIPYELPKGWEWVKLCELCYLITDGTHYTPRYVDSGVPFLSVKDVAHGKVDFSNCKKITLEEHKELTKRCKPEKNDILLTKVGTTGIAIVVDTEKEFSIFVSVALIKYPQNLIYPRFLEHLLNSPIVKNQSDAGTEGIGNKNLVLRKIINFDVPLPPLPEQIRIVEKVDQLMKLCNELESKVKENQKNSELLMEAVLREAFEV